MGVKLSDPFTNMGAFYSGITSEPADTLKHIFRGIVEGTMDKSIPPFAKVLSPFEALTGVAAVLAGFFTLNPFEIGFGAAEIGDAFGRYLQIGRDLVKGPPVP